MTDPSPPAGDTVRRIAESLLGFWSEAGVDACHEDEPVDRTAPRRAPATSPAGARAAPPPASAVEQGPVGPGEADRIAEARAAANAASDLIELAAAIAAFDGCGLKHAGARQAVCWRGIADAPLLIIGEGPGAEEDARGEPFVGRAGRLLDLMLRHSGLAERSFITNTVYWRPPANRTPTLAEQRACAPFLERTIALVRPRLLLLVGAAAARSVLGVAGGILSLRGRWSEWRAADDEPPIPVMPTLHPAFLLRQPSAKKLAWADLLSVADRLDRLESRL